jgi:hypothetical protein
MRLIPRTDLKRPRFTEGEMEPYELPLRQRVVHHWQLVISFAFAVAGGTGAGAFFSDLHGRILRKWVLRGNGKPLIVMSGQALAIYALIFMRELYEQTPPTALAAGTNQADRELRLFLPAAMGHTLAGQEETFGFPPLTDPSMEFHWGDAEDLASGTDGALTLTNPLARLVEYSYDNPRPPAGGYSPLLAYTREIAVNGVEDIVFTLTELEAGYELRALIIEGLIDGQAGGRDFIYSNDVVQSVKLLEVNGRELHKDVQFSDLQQENKQDYGIEALADLEGIAVIDAAADRNVARGELWVHQVRGHATLQLSCEKQGADQNKVRVTSIFTAR